MRTTSPTTTPLLYCLHHPPPPHFTLHNGGSPVLLNKHTAAAQPFGAAYVSVSTPLDMPRRSRFVTQCHHSPNRRRDITPSNLSGSSTPGRPGHGRRWPHLTGVTNTHTHNSIIIIENAHRNGVITSKTPCAQAGERCWRRRPTRRGVARVPRLVVCITLVARVWADVKRHE